MALAGFDIGPDNAAPATSMVKAIKDRVGLVRRKIARFMVFPFL